MLKTDDTCQFTELPGYMNVSTMAAEFEFQDGNMTNEKVTKLVLKAGISRFGSRRRAELLPEVQDLCKKVPLVETHDIGINETEYEKFKSGEVIFLNNTRSTRDCIAVGSLRNFCDLNPYFSTKHALL